MLSSITADLSFAEATEHYLKLRSVAATPGAISARYIRPNTEQDYRQKLGAALLFFGEMTLGEIHWYHMKSYQAARVAGEEWTPLRPIRSPPQHPAARLAALVLLGRFCPGRRFRSMWSI